MVQHLICRRLLHNAAPKVTVDTFRQTPTIQSTRLVTPSFLSWHLRRSENVVHLRPTSNNAPTEKTNAISTAGTLFFTSLCAITFGLGVWQTQRYFEKVELVKRREEDLKMNPLTWDEWIASHSQGGNRENSLEDGAGKVRTYRRVILQGTFQHHNQILVGPRGPPPGALAESGPNSGRGGGGGMSSSRQGYWVVTPFLVCKNTESQSLSESKETEDDGGKDTRGWFKRLTFRGNGQTYSNAAVLKEECPKEECPKEETIVWINRGWIPRHFVDNQSKIQHEWEKPSGVVEVTTMESETETPGRFSPPSRLDTRVDKGSANSRDFDVGTVQKLLWMDRDAISEMTNCPKELRPPLFVQTKDEIYSPSPALYPARSSREHVGEFKVTPEVHAGYAVTWFGLSGAGMVMTRKLLNRGR
ncbi:hypothetical protein HJC23_013788 [Cyclotella cryptica]|uniref:SURF1-like protein n=1 Tax=Cyclotella cryptica TaxID=29204 RepID=A0ABD3PG24_9STRA|eukprot:CCRYP_014956-RA/>CCRYP_014956-RA protein AED:0.31 eAED:0.31 QI:139/-1/1/1/-1/1/1/302/415